ncbi:Uncharacterised protein [Vibrio cholerae]|nr:Uncharacterised protein [Vibrio cholerae]
MQILFDQAKFRFAARTVITLKVRANQHIIKLHALRFKNVHHHVMRRIEIRLRVA